MFSEPRGDDLKLHVLSERSFKASMNSVNNYVSEETRKSRRLVYASTQRRNIVTKPSKNLGQQHRSCSEHRGAVNA